MKRIGFIDLHIDEWHANNYPTWFRESKNWEGFELGTAWEESPQEGGLPLERWCQNTGMTAASSIEEVIDKSDCICVLAPSNPEAHERLSNLALRAGKPLYIDKTFAPDKATAVKFFSTAKVFGTPLMSSSALRYGEELVRGVREVFSEEKPLHITTEGGGRTFDEYSIHQIEMVVATLGVGASSVMRIPNAAIEQYVVKYHDGVRSAYITFSPAASFAATIFGRDRIMRVPGATNIFPRLLDEILDFFKTGKSKIDSAETIEVAAIREAALSAGGAVGKEVLVL